MDNEKIDDLMDEVRGTAYALSNGILDLIDEYDVDMREEILEYLKEKMESESNG